MLYTKKKKFESYTNKHNTSTKSPLPLQEDDHTHGMFHI